MFGPGYDDALCGAVEDHRYDYVWVSEPFAAIPGAVTSAGIASVLLTVLFLLWATLRRAHLFTLVTALLAGAYFCDPRRRSSWREAADGALGILPAGGIPGYALPLLGLSPIIAAVALAVSTATTGLSRTRRRGARGTSIAWLAVAAAMLVAYPLADYVLLIGYSGSYDTPVGSGMPGAVLLVIAGVCFAVVAVGSSIAKSARVGAPEVHEGALP